MTDDWQPIETAPRDGTAILAWDSLAGGPEYAMITVYWCAGNWCLCQEGAHATDGWAGPGITYWRHLPESPDHALADGGNGRT